MFFAMIEIFHFVEVNLFVPCLDAIFGQGFFKIKKSSAV